MNRSAHPEPKVSFVSQLLDRSTRKSHVAGAGLACIFSKEVLNRPGIVASRITVAVAEKRTQKQRCIARQLASQGPQVAVSVHFQHDILVRARVLGPVRARVLGRHLKKAQVMNEAFREQSCQLSGLGRAWTPGSRGFVGRGATPCLIEGLSQPFLSLLPVLRRHIFGGPMFAKAKDGEGRLHGWLPFEI